MDIETASAGSARVERRAFLKTVAVASAALAVPKAAFAAERTKVVVIGGGLAGLIAALTLKDAGADVILLEAGQRIGGRVFTADDVELKPEYGASQIGRSYARALDLCRRFDLKLVPENRDVLPMSNFIGGKWIRSDQWEASDLNPLVGAERKFAPAMLGSQLMSKYNRLEELGDWLDPKFADLDVSFRTLLERHGHSEAALRFANLSTTGNDLDSASMLSLMQEQTRARFDMKFGGASAPTDRPYGFRENERPADGLATLNNIVGGTSRLTDAMASALGDGVRRRKLAARVEMTAAGAEVVCVDASRYRADFVIAAVPFTILRRMTVEPGLPPLQGEIVRNMPYGHTTRGFGVIRAPYWEQDGYEPSFFTDGAIKMFWALKPRPDESDHRFMVVFTGASAERIDLLGEADARAFVEAELGRIRPSMRGKLQLQGWYSWGRDALVQGCRHIYAPGQVTRLAAAMIEPHGRLHFAGEHTRRLDFGMEAALESGERAATEVLQRLS
jgi:monoamine oxidase